MDKKNEVVQMKAQDRSDRMTGKAQGKELESELCSCNITWTTHNHLSTEVLNLDNNWVSGLNWNCWNWPLSNNSVEVCQ